MHINDRWSKSIGLRHYDRIRILVLLIFTKPILKVREVTLYKQFVDSIFIHGDTWVFQINASMDLHF